VQVSQEDYIPVAKEEKKSKSKKVIDEMPKSIKEQYG
jgi:hypothetical protein